jgi:hypothetical protein
MIGFNAFMPNAGVAVMRCAKWFALSYCPPSRLLVCFGVMALRQGYALRKHPAKARSAASLAPRSSCNSSSFFK